METIKSRYMNVVDIIRVCEQIAEDAKNDATNFDGQPFTGRTVAEYFGNHGASIAALANILKVVVEEVQNIKEPINH